VQSRPRAPASDGFVPSRVEPLPDGHFGVAYFEVPPITAGQATGSLVAGIGAILVSTVVGCFGLAGASGGWGALVGGAFAVLAGLAGAAGIGLGLVGLRRVQRGAGQVVGRGLAIAGISCAGAGICLTLLSMALAVALGV
jgi:hypothetical protein